MRKWDCHVPPPKVRIIVAGRQLACAVSSHAFAPDGHQTLPVPARRGYRLVVCPSALDPLNEFLLKEVELVATLAVWDASLRGERVHRGAFLANELTSFVHRHHLVIILDWG